MKRFFLVGIVISGALTSAAAAPSTAVAKALNIESHAMHGLMPKVPRLASSKLDALLRAPVEKGRLTELEAMRVKVNLRGIPFGEELVKACLNKASCDVLAMSRRAKALYRLKPTPKPEALKLASQDEFYHLVLSKNPSLDRTHLLQKAGNITEGLMDFNLQRSGWKKIPGEVGRNGVDGLYIKQNRNGDVTDVMFVEAKYGSAQLKTVKSGAQQMSPDWIDQKIQALANKHPDDKRYRQIHRHLKQGNVRMRLYRMKVENGVLYQTLDKITPVSPSSVKTGSLQGGNKTIVNYGNNMAIDLNNPANAYQRQLRDKFFALVQ